MGDEVAFFTCKFGLKGVPMVILILFYLFICLHKGKKI